MTRRELFGVAASSLFDVGRLESLLRSTRVHTVEAHVHTFSAAKPFSPEAAAWIEEAQRLFPARVRAGDACLRWRFHEHVAISKLPGDVRFLVRQQRWSKGQRAPVENNGLVIATEKGTITVRRSGWRIS